MREWAGHDPMVEAKDAVKTALAFVDDLYGKDKLEGLLLEEVELSGDESYWIVTIGLGFQEHMAGNVR